jgi:hypothetical protein
MHTVRTVLACRHEINVRIRNQGCDGLLEHGDLRVADPLFGERGLEEVRPPFAFLAVVGATKKSQEKRQDRSEFICAQVHSTLSPYLAGLALIPPAFET